MSIDVTAENWRTSAAANALDYGNVMPGDEQIDHVDISLTLPTVNGVTVTFGAADAKMADGVLATP